MSIEPKWPRPSEAGDLPFVGTFREEPSHGGFGVYDVYSDGVTVVWADRRPAGSNTIERWRALSPYSAVFGTSRLAQWANEALAAIDARFGKGTA